jgi:hypothetical protein
MSVVMMLRSPMAAPRNIDAVTPETGPESSVQERRFARACDRYRAAAALGDLQPCE